jgi:hypothetical protein
MSMETYRQTYIYVVKLWKGNQMENKIKKEFMNMNSR